MEKLRSPIPRGVLRYFALAAAAWPALRRQFKQAIFTRLYICQDSRYAANSHHPSTRCSATNSMTASEAEIGTS
jgi:hypothetical protein